MTGKTRYEVGSWDLNDDNTVHSSVPISFFCQAFLKLPIITKTFFAYKKGKKLHNWMKTMNNSILASAFSEIV